MNTIGKLKAQVAALSTAMSSLDRDILSNMKHDGTRWLLNNEPMDSALQTQLNQLFVKMEHMADDAKYALGFTV
jgi:hypothetical protein